MLKTKLTIIGLLIIANSGILKAQSKDSKISKDTKPQSQIKKALTPEPIKVRNGLIAKHSDVQPKVGEPMPNFNLNDIHYFPQKRASLNDFKGKWLILDFFTKNCIACFASFPKINKLQNEFRDKIQFVLIGDNEHKYGRNVAYVYEKVKQKQGLTLSVAYDSVLFEKWGISSVPYIIVVDDNGIVKAINNSQDINSENLNALIDKKDISSSFRNIDYETWDINKPFLTDDNGGPDTAFTFRSILSLWKRPTDFMVPKSITQYNKEIMGRRGYQATGAPISALYSIAYLDRLTVSSGDSLYGETTRLPIFLDIDSSKIVSDSKTGKNLYNYSLSIPSEKASTAFIMEVMQRDLMNYFGYEAKEEDRLMPYYRLTASEAAKKNLKTKGVKFFKNNGAAGFEMKDASVKKLLSFLRSYHQLKPPILDDTKITTNIDIDFDCLMTDLKDIKRELQKHGLDLIEDKKIMRVLVVRGK